MKYGFAAARPGSGATRHRSLTYALWLVAIALVVGCNSIPRGRASIDAVEVEGAEELSESEVTEKMATTPSSKFLGFFRGVVYEYEIFNHSVLQTDLQRIERYYRARGFYKARVRAARIFYEDDQHVRVQVEVQEGPQVTVRRVVVRGIAHLPEEIRRAASRAAARPIRVGSRFEEEEFGQAEQDLKRALTDNGYAYAEVTRIAEVDLPHDWASVAFDVKPHEPAEFGEVRIEGLEDLPEAPVRRAIDIQPGDPYSTSDIESAQQTLLELGVFSSVTIEPQLDDPPPAARRVPLVVRVEPSRLRSVSLGGGVQVDDIRTDVHLTAGWEHRNFFGGLRRFNVQFRPGVVFYPTRIGHFQAPTDFLPEARLRTELRQPGFIEARTNGFVRTEYSVSPVLLTEDINEDWPVLGYREARIAVGVDRVFGRLFISPMHNLQQNTPFVYKGKQDDDLGPILVSYPQIMTILDLRDDRIQPHKGLYVSNDLQVAGLGGDARDIKVQPDVRGYIPLTKRFTLALRTSVGFLFPQNYGDTLEANSEFNASQAPGDPEVSRKDWVKDVQLTFLRGFFSGGPSSNRGYAARGIGPHGVIPFYNPETSGDALAQNCNPGVPKSDEQESECELPLGGLSLWEASVELRTELVGPLSSATFCDAGDVSPKQVDLRLNRLHLSCGLGFRYATPVGPIRLDAAFRIPGMQITGDDYGETPDELFGAPIQVSFGIGEAF